MLVAAARFDLRVPGCTSLKEKRHVVKTLIASLRGKFNVAVAEVDHQDLWQRSRLTAALTGGSLAVLAAAADNVERWLEARWPDNVHVERILTSVDDLCA